MKCYACDNKEQLKQLRIYKSELWTVELHSNQSYLGRCVIALNRHFEDFAKISEEEVTELWKLIQRMDLCIKKSFNPDLINYAVLGNEDRHIHVHVVPRYSQTVQFQKIAFKDTKWGSNYSGYDKHFQIKDSVKQKIIDKLKTNI